MIRHIARCVVWLGLVWLAVPTPAAEIFVLRNGSRIVGELLNADESPREKFVVLTESGAKLTFTKDQVEQMLHPRPNELEYEKIKAGYSDTAEAQWQLAMWCQDKNLVPERKKHMQRVIELDPNHLEARRALGYSKVEGKWTTQDELMKSRGYVLYKGRWRLPQEIEIEENKQNANKAEKEWAQKVNRWLEWVDSRDRDQAGRDNLRAIEDPLAVKALVGALRTEKRPKARVLLIEPLAKIGSADALHALATTSLEDGVEEVRLSCLDYLKKGKSPEVVSFYVGPSGLKSKDNIMVNRAAVALSALRDRTTVGPLIDALVTQHKYKLVTSGSGGSPGSISTSFGTGGNSGGGGMSMGGGGPKIIKKDISNQAVLDALTVLTGGVNFGFDVKAWKNWFAAQKNREIIDARRGSG